MTDADAILLCLWEIAARLDKITSDRVKDIIEDPKREGNKKPSRKTKRRKGKA